MLKALRHRPIALLWVGQAASAIGDEIYRVALVWLAVSYVGAKAGYLAAGQAGILLLFSLIGGAWSDRWDSFKTLIWIDILRAGIVMIPVLTTFYGYSSIKIIWLVALSLAAVSAFFDPVLQSVLPRFAKTPELLQATTGLMSTTLRLARVLGPSLIGVLSSFIPMIHFFSIDAISFLISTLSILALTRHTPPVPVNRPARVSLYESIVSGFQLVRRTRVMRLMMTAKAICGGTWNLAYGLGLALLVRQIAPNDMKAFGWVLGTYGLGNLAAALVLGNLPRVRLSLLVYCGYLVLGGGFLWMALSQGLTWLMWAAAFTAIGGPLNDLPFIDLIQRHFTVNEIPKVFRQRMVLDTGATLVGMLLSPTLFSVFSIRSVVGACGVITVVVGIWGLSQVKKLDSLHYTKS